MGALTIGPPERKVDEEVYLKPKKILKQTGVVKDIKRDMLRIAKPPGKRISRTGKVYYEYRKNRSDIPNNNI